MAYRLQMVVSAVFALSVQASRIVADEREAARKVQAHVVALGVFCDRMCKAVNAYPNCACPAPTEAELNAAAAAAGIPPCIFKHCPKDGTGICPNVQFMTCVESSYKPSLAQFKSFPALPDLQKRLSALQTAISVQSNPAMVELETRRKIQSHVMGLGVFCDRMCKAVNAYPNCACPAPTEAELNAAAAAAGIPPCIFKHCPKDGTGICPNVQFMTCVESSYKPSLAQLRQLPPVSTLKNQFAALQTAINLNSNANTSELEMRRKVQAHVLSMGVFCDRMCKAVNAYPNCACPAPTEAELNAAAAAAGIPPCIFKHCPKDGEGICPNVQFMTCVESSYKPSLAQVKALPTVPELQKTLAALQTAVQVYSADKEELDAKQKLQAQVLGLGVFCDRMCKAVNAYPNCACPAPTEAELNAAAAAAGIPPCIFKHCPKDGEGICPNVQFMTCVESSYKPSLVQVKKLGSITELKKKVADLQAAITVEQARQSSHNKTSAPVKQHLRQ